MTLLSSSSTSQGFGRSPLLGHPRAVASPGDADLAWHYGDPLREQRAAARGPVLIDCWTGGLLMIEGADRLAWLHEMSSQHLADLSDGAATETMWLSPRGHIEHWADVLAASNAVLLRTEPGAAGPLAEFLRTRTFRADVRITDRSADDASMTLLGARALAVAGDTLADFDPPGHRPVAGRAVMVDGGVAAGGWLRVHPERVDVTVPRSSFEATAQALINAGSEPAGTWAAEALRIAARRPRFGVDNDARTIPNETPWLDSAVHLHKGCYCGQETVARIENLGHPPRRMVLLNVDGTADRLPAAGSDVTTHEGKTVGRMGAAAYHYEDGPIALALIKRTIGPDTPLVADGVDVAVDPDDAADDARPPSVDLRRLPNFRRLRRQ